MAKKRVGTELLDVAAAGDGHPGRAQHVSNLPIAVRVYPDSRQTITRGQPSAPKTYLVFDTETTVDSAQRLTFGSFRYYRERKCVQEGIFYADELSKRDLATLRAYVRSHRPNLDVTTTRPLQFLARSQFVNRGFYQAAFKARSMVVGFNLPFDISRLAVRSGAARVRKNRRGEKTGEQYSGGFSFTLWSYLKNGKVTANPKRPQIRIKSIDSKRSLKAFTSPDEIDDEDAQPDSTIGSETESGFTFRGHFLDLRTLVFALTDRGHSLASACEEFSVEHAKTMPARHGEITPAYIDYNRRDVLATSELLFKVLDEYEKHPIDLQATKAYSPASIGKAYLRSMGIQPVLDRQPDFPKNILGHSMTAFFGGRTECRIRRVPVPVVYLDFLSMYPTVNALMDLWSVVTARNVKVEDATSEVQALLATLTPDKLFDPENWKKIVGLALLEPDQEVLPVRAKYDAANTSWQIGVNPLTTDSTVGQLWFTIADVAASALLTGKSPRIVRAVRFKGEGWQPDLSHTSLRGVVDVDPNEQDFFRTVIEERKKLQSKPDLSATEVKRLDVFLKILANATAYGITAEIIRHELPGKEKKEAALYSIGDDPFVASVRSIEEPGEFCFPPLAATITGAARLLLALLERCVSDLGGAYAMCDTDSMAIVAKERDGLVRCEGGGRKLPDGADAVRALSWEQVNNIRGRFNMLNPYANDAIPGSILKLEDDNLTPETRKQRQLWCYAISAKRYALYLRDADGSPVLIQEGVNNPLDGWSEHGLGHLLNPVDPKVEDRDWIRQSWEMFIREAHGLPTKLPTWLNRPAIGRTTVSSPFLHRAFSELNDKKAYSDAVKPFNFLLTAHVAHFGHPTGADPEKFHLVAPYQTDARQWRKMGWIDLYSKERFNIKTSGSTGGDGVARVKTYGDVLSDYRYHPEAKSLASSGDPCGRSDAGVLRRRPVHASWVTAIGKESNDLELVQAGLVHKSEAIYSEYERQGRSYWLEVVLPVLRLMPLRVLVEKSGLSASALKEIRAARARPRAHNQRKLCDIAFES